MKSILALALAAVATAAPLTGPTVHTVSLAMASGSTKNVGTLQGVSGVSTSATCLNVPLDASWTGLSLAVAALSTSRAACAHTQVFAVRGQCTSAGFPSGTAVLLSTDGVALFDKFVRGTDIPDDTESIAILCESALPPTEAEQRAQAMVAAPGVHA